ncbi:MAG: tRNA dimethylallyltransferase [Ignavibacterium sp.]|uniref:tRNA (adenosine(37)-N6)-dimethylallyltransferase MiaA n=1 Tax=Ignavibacterium sp. TaxID=2651167 RepID=UPI0021DC9276|nr:tRNA (adenosine(37)-N6)-dimethylallyltransferase MiaA [Ignavibacterium sp.]BDQ01810.1 MAG: tRNA dimethylallyltransferase [Ignavibacterium sp.]GIV45812.1 MAG: tRNA dimethylallyltransferase [Ignavibacterium sp.]
MKNSDKVIVIVGPTCSGKTRLSLILAEKINGEIISADSRQVYKHLSIGTAKPTEKQLNSVKHYFVDELNPDEEFNADIFSRRANEIIRSLLGKNLTPVVVGGSGLYIKALIDGITQTIIADKSLREELLEARKIYGNEYVYNELKKIDPVSAERMLPQNWKRVLRAIEVFKLTGKPIWQHHLENNSKPEFNFIQYGLLWDRKKLYQNIEQRVNQMISDGLVDEVKEILRLGYSKGSNSLNTVGYKELIDFIENKITFEQAVYLIKRNTRRYAKRQMTWFKSDKRINWIRINSFNEIDEIAENILKDFYERKN